MMDESLASPRITRLAWGRIEIEGGRRFKDAKLYPGGCREWNWKETGTGHTPGIQPADIEELLEHGATVVVLSRGMYGRLEVCPETLMKLEERGIPVHILRTKDAVQRYNELREAEPVGGLFHTTC
ncbi:MAG: Mth938-like domain-containing protein [Candidatus Neomarinimicrobiota bacterium]